MAIVELGGVSLSRGDTQGDENRQKKAHMLPNSHSCEMSAVALEAAIDLLLGHERRWRRTGRKRVLYRFLESVLNLYAAWKNAGIAQAAANRMGKLTGPGTQQRRHPVRAIIDATSTADRKSKTRWTQALRFAWRKRSIWKDLEKCLRANRGIAGCADRWADIQAENRTPKGFVRVGGEDRFPKIPFFVSVELLGQHGDYR